MKWLDLFSNDEILLWDSICWRPKPFYQLGNLFVYKLRCTRFEYSNERIDTNVSEINKVEDDKSLDLLAHQVSLENEVFTIRMMNILLILKRWEKHNKYAETQLLSQTNATSNRWHMTLQKKPVSNRWSLMLEIEQNNWQNN